MNALDRHKRIKRITKILFGKFARGDRVKVVRMPPDHSVMWREEWVGFEGIYIRPCPWREKGLSQVYFPDKNILCSEKDGWLVDNAQLEHL